MRDHETVTSIEEVRQTHFAGRLEFKDIVGEFLAPLIGVPERAQSRRPLQEREHLIALSLGEAVEVLQRRYPITPHDREYGPFPAYEDSSRRRHVNLQVNRRQPRPRSLDGRR